MIKEYQAHSVQRSKNIRITGSKDQRISESVSRDKTISGSRCLGVKVHQALRVTVLGQKNLRFTVFQDQCVSGSQYPLTRASQVHRIPGQRYVGFMVF